jgi:hypothetical protein
MEVSSSAAGHELVVGDAVLLLGGAHAGQLAEVVGWGGRRGVELIVHGPVPAFLAVPPPAVERVEVGLLDPVLPPVGRRATQRAAYAGESVFARQLPYDTLVHSAAARTPRC